jgi:hypothetical protein
MYATTKGGTYARTCIIDWSSRREGLKKGFFVSLPSVCHTNMVDVPSVYYSLCP